MTLSDKPQINQLYLTLMNVSNYNIELHTSLNMFFYEWTEICMYILHTMIYVYSNAFSKLDECVFFFLSLTKELPKSVFL